VESGQGDERQIGVSAHVCIASGECARAVPEVFGQRPDGTVMLLRPRVPLALAERVRRAAADCPSGAIKVAPADDNAPPRAAPAGAQFTPELAVRSYYSLVDANDFTALVRLFSEHAVYRRPGYEPLAGREALAAFYGGQRVIAHGRHEIAEIVADGRKVAVHGRFTGQIKNGDQVALRFADFFTLDPAGLFESRDTFFFAPMV
jgi:steroid Delta-isomerase